MLVSKMILLSLVSGRESCGVLGLCASMTMCQGIDCMITNAIAIMYGEKYKVIGMGWGELALGGADVHSDPMGSGSGEATTSSGATTIASYTMVMRPSVGTYLSAACRLAHMTTASCSPMPYSSSTTLLADLRNP